MKAAAIVLAIALGAALPTGQATASTTGHTASGPQGTSYIFPCLKVSCRPPVTR